MEESQVIRELTAEAVEKSRLQARREYVLIAAKARFQNKVTKEDERMIAKQDSLAVLDEWFKAAVTAKTYPAFRKVMRE